MRDYRNIKAHQLADRLVVEVYKVSREFPKDEMYGLTSQLRRAAVSVPANIAEGASRQHKKDCLQFLYISRGSLAEVGYLLELANKINYFNNQQFVIIDDLQKETARTLFGLIQSVEKDI